MTRMSVYISNPLWRHTAGNSFSWTYQVGSISLSWNC